MRERLYLSLLIGVLLCLAGWTAHAQLQKSSPAVRTWEYKVFMPRDPRDGPTLASENELNQYGSQGWELVSKDGYVYIFKRPK